VPSIDFLRVRETVTIAQVLELLGFVPVERSGDQLRGPCPLHGASSPRSRSFSVSLGRNAFRCFGCGRSGNQLDLWAAAQAVTVHEAALDLCSRFNVDPPRLAGGERKGRR